MARSLPMYANVAEIQEAVGTTEATTATQIVDSDGRGCAGVLVRGVQGILQSTGGKVTINIYDQATVSGAREYYSVEFDFTSTKQTSDTQDPGIPVMVDPYATLTADATADGKIFVALFYLQKIAVVG
jgi:hypothetical protein